MCQPLAMLAFNTEVAHSRAFVGVPISTIKVHGLEDLRLHLSPRCRCFPKDAKHRINLLLPLVPCMYGSVGGESILKATFH